MKRLIAVLTVSLLILSGCGTSQMASGDPGAIFAGAAIGGNVGGAIGEAVIGARPSAQLSEPLPEQPLGMPSPPRNRKNTAIG